MTDIFFDITNLTKKNIKCRKASMEEAIKNNEVKLYGYYRVDDRILNYNKKNKKIKKDDIIKIKDKYIDLIAERRKLIKKKLNINDDNQVLFIDGKIKKLTDDIEELKLKLQK